MSSCAQTSTSGSCLIRFVKITADSQDILGMINYRVSLLRVKCMKQCKDFRVGLASQEFVVFFSFNNS